MGERITQYLSTVDLEIHRSVPAPRKKQDVDSYRGTLVVLLLLRAGHISLRFHPHL